MSIPVPPTGALWRKLVAPAPQVTDLGERRSAELLSILLLVILVVTTATVSALGIVASTFVGERLPLLAGTLLWFCALYALGRTRHYRVAAFLFCAGPVFSDVGVGLATPDDPIWFAFLPLGPILAAALLSLRSATVIGALGVAGAGLVLVVRRGDIGVERGAAMVAAVAVVSAVVIGTAWFRASVERQRQEEVQRLAAQLAATERSESIGRLAGGVAHDFNNLLTVIVTSAELIHEGVDADELAHEISAAAARGAALTRQLMALSRSRVAAAKVVELDALIDRMRTLIRRLLPENVTLELKLNSAGRVSLDPNQLEHALINLAANARDAMPDGGTLRITTSAVDASPQGLLPREHLLLTVTDTGAGMDEFTRARALQPFFTTKASGHGTGLGLATVAGVVRQLGGGIALLSTPGRGTEVRIALPRSYAAPSSSDRLQLPRAHTTTGCALLVEDEPEVRRAVERVLRNAGFRVVSAANAEEVPRALAEADDHIDILVTDVVMPGLSGVALSAQLRATRPELPVLLMSGYSEEQIPTADDDPNTRLLPKPFDPAELTALVSELLSVARAPAIARAAGE